MSDAPWTGRKIGFWGPEEKARCKSGMNMAMIATLRAWAEKFLGPSALVIERSETGTRVALRFLLGDAVCEIDMYELGALNRRRLPPIEREESLRKLVRTPLS